MSIVRSKSQLFAKRIVKMYKYIAEKYQEFVLSKQILRSWTAIGALLHEAEFAQSPADYINKMNVALKEANETKYWLDLLQTWWYLSTKQFENINNDCLEIVKMLVSSIKTLKKSNLNKKTNKQNTF